MTVKDVFLENIIPAFGGLVGVMMFASPLKAVLRARREKTLGDFNPMPLPAICSNCVGWIGYSFVVKDTYVFVPNEIGFLLGLFYTLSCYGLMDSKSRDRQLAILLLFGTVLSVVGAIGAIGNLAYDPLRLLWGFTCNAILLVYYSAPLSTVYTVVRTRNASSLYWPLSLMNIINGSLWTAYGIAITDYFIWVPNCVGAILAALTLVLIWIFPSKAKGSPPSSSHDSEAPLAGDPESTAASAQRRLAEASGRGLAAGGSRSADSDSPKEGAV